MQMIHSPMQWEGDTHTHTHTLTEAVMDFCKDGVFFKTFLRSFLINPRLWQPFFPRDLRAT
jgi:hypothetical protein